MVEILQNKDNTEKIEFDARDGNINLGKIAGFLDGDSFVIDELECEGFFTDGLVRAILNLMNLHGIDKARFDVPGYTEILKKLGFFTSEPVIESIEAFFEKGCGK